MIAVGAIDVGSPASGKLGWAILTPDAATQTGRDLDEFITAMIATCAHWPAAIGFEAPMFVPVRARAVQVLTARRGEGSRPWSAGAGAAVTAAGLGVVTYTLAALRKGMTASVATTRYADHPAKPGEVMFFEAFVSQADKGADHADDALIAARAMAAQFDGSAALASCLDEPEVFSLLGAAMLRTGWSTDLSELSRPCLVVRPLPKEIA